MNPTRTITLPLTVLLLAGALVALAPAAHAEHYTCQGQAGLARVCHPSGAPSCPDGYLYGYEVLGREEHQSIEC